jgi:hypothetical protein
MTDFDTSDRVVSRAIRSWLHEDRHEDVSRIAGAVLDRVEATPQRRTTWWPPRRESPMNRLFAIGLGAAAVIVIFVVGTQLLGPGEPAGVGAAPSASASPTQASTATNQPSTSTGSTSPLTQSFTSTVHGLSVSVPEGWKARAATEPWTNAPGAQYVDPGIDVLQDPILGDHLFLAIASQSIGDTTPEDWIAEHVSGWDEGCTPAEPITVGESSGLTGPEGCDFAAVTSDGRGYWIALLASQDDPPAVAAYDRAWFEEVLATVRLHPEDAVD